MYHQIIIFSFGVLILFVLIIFINNLNQTQYLENELKLLQSENKNINSEFNDQYHLIMNHFVLVYSQLNTNQININEIENSMNSLSIQLTNITNQTMIQSDQIDHLQNLPSNLEVYHQMEFLKSNVTEELNEAKQYFNYTTYTIQNNITNQLINASNNMNHNMNIISSMVNNASISIKSLQYNVTNQLNEIVNDFNHSMVAINQSMIITTLALNEQVKGVQSNINDYYYISLK